MSANKIVNMLVNIATIVALRAKEDMTIPIHGKWGITLLQDELKEEVVPFLFMR